MNLKINDVFWTFQGEGANWGRRALFVRMSFCNLSCKWCDTTFNSYKDWTEEEFVEFAKSESCRFAVITGGEPTINKHTPRIVELLNELHFEIAIETNGTFPIPKGIDFVTVSPKKDADYDIHLDALTKADEFKYVIDEGFKWEVLKKHLDDGRKFSLSPEFGRFEESLKEIMDYIKENPMWRISLQTHKWMKIP